MIEISKPLEYFQSCNCCGRYNKRGPGNDYCYQMPQYDGYVKHL